MIQPIPKRRIRVLLLEDKASDAELVVRELSRSGYELEWRRVQTEADYLAQLDPSLAVILADYNMPQFDAPRALQLLRESKLRIPFIIVSGSIGEDAAVRAIKLGADDYLLKDRLGRLGQAVGQVLEAQKLREERRRVEDALRESEERYRLLLERVPDAILLHSEGRVIWANSAAAALLKAPCFETLLGKPMMEILHPDYRQTVQARIDQAIANKTTSFLEHRIVCLDGAEMEVESIEIPFDHAGKAAVQTIIRDITTRKSAERRIKAFSDLGQKLSSAKTVREAAAIILHVADQLHRWDACSFDLYSGEQGTLSHVLAQDTINGRRVECESGYNNSIPSPRASRVIHEGGMLVLRDERASVAFAGVPFGDKARPSASAMLVPIRHGAEVIGVLTIHSYAPRAYRAEDLRTLQSVADHCGGAVNRIHAEEERTRLAQRMQLLLDSTGEGICGVDLTGRCTFINQSGATLLGYGTGEPVGQDLHLLAQSRRLDGSAYPESESPLSRARREGVACQMVSEVFWTRDGRAIAVECSSFPIIENGKVTGAVVIFLDITQRKQMETQLRQLQKMEAIGQLASGVAHDFNNILTVIQGHASLIEYSQDSPEAVMESVGEIQGATERAANLTHQLLAFSRKLVIQPRELDLNELAGNISRMLKRVLGEDILLEVIAFPNLPAVQADPGMMDQILLNLAVNSRDAMPRGGKLVISTSVRILDRTFVEQNPEARTGEFVCLRVADSGTGIAPEHLAHIFEPFFTTKDVDKGTGLGLATVYGIVKQHQGWITVQSELGKGAIFEVFLPSLGMRKGNPRVRQAEEDYPRGAETILLVEDDKAVCQTTHSFLARLGYRVIDASSGAAAVEVFKQNRNSLHLVLMDIVLPGGMTGLELAQQLCREKGDLKIILTSGYSGDVISNAMLSNREAWFLQKPCPPHELARAVRDCLDGKPMPAT